MQVDKSPHGLGGILNDVGVLLPLIVLILLRLVVLGLVLFVHDCPDQVAEVLGLKPGNTGR